MRWLNSRWLLENLQPDLGQKSFSEALLNSPPSLLSTALVFVKINYSFIHLLVMLNRESPWVHICRNCPLKIKTILPFLSMGAEFHPYVFLVCMRPVENTSCIGWGGVSEGLCTLLSDSVALSLLDNLLLYQLSFELELNFLIFVIWSLFGSFSLFNVPFIKVVTVLKFWSSVLNRIICS